MNFSRFFLKAKIEQILTNIRYENISFKKYYKNELIIKIYFKRLLNQHFQKFLAQLFYKENECRNL